MLVRFLDTSALQHQYVDGVHSLRIRQMLGRAASACVIADTTMLEMPSALATICRGKSWGVKTFDRLHRQFIRDVAEDVIEVRMSGVREIRRAIHLLRFAGVVKKKGLISADALIAACALEYAMEKQQVISFYTSDWPLYSCLRDLNAFRTTMNLYLVGATKDGTKPHCRV